MNPPATVEHERLRQARVGEAAWRRWGPYLSERAWGTVREDLSRDGNAWESFPHDHARSRAYHWGEDGLAGFCDEQMRLCFALALWNGRDPILKERLFGLANGEGNHGEDVKEYYYYLDSTPTHSYMRMLYKYPHREYPYTDLVMTNRARGRRAPEYELVDTGVFDDDRYFDVFVEYAKASPDEILIRVTAHNRGLEAAPLHVLPHLWFRNTWWRNAETPRPTLERAQALGATVVCARHSELGTRYLYGEGTGELLFTENETNTVRLSRQPSATPFVKDGIHDAIVHGRTGAVNPKGCGTKAAFHYQLEVAGGATRAIRLRFGQEPMERGANPFAGFDALIAERRRQADAFYETIIPPSVDLDGARVARQAFAGMLWSKQTYVYDVHPWLAGRAGATGRHREGRHTVCTDVISMPDKWEYPWFAAWDLAFHALALAPVDPDYAREQLELLLGERYLHPTGQIHACEGNVGDVNPPVHAWATLFMYRYQREQLGDQAFDFLRRAFHTLLLNFTWWLNRKDRTGRNAFEGGFLGLDNIGVFDRSAPLPTGGCLEQADGTAWMALYAQNMLDIALELALHDPAYEDLAVRFYTHAVGLAAAMDRIGERQDEMWDEHAGFFYDVLRLPDGTGMRLGIRSLAGLLPLCATTVYPEEVLAKLPRFVAAVRAFNQAHPDLLGTISRPERPGVAGRRMLAVLDETKLRRVLARLLDPAEFLSEYGIRALSRHHLQYPFGFRAGGEELRVGYLPAESDSAMFGGNANWRGPIWMPVNVLLIRALLQMYAFYGDDVRVECPTGSGRTMTLFEVSGEIAQRLAAIFLRNGEGRRAVHGGVKKFQDDPHWRDLILFYEYFHGDNGAGIGASHQTGWSGLIAALICLFNRMTPAQYLQNPRAR
jgi:hypothetical protein